MDLSQNQPIRYSNPPIFIKSEAALRLFDCLPPAGNIVFMFKWWISLEACQNDFIPLKTLPAWQTLLKMMK